MKKVEEQYDVPVENILALYDGLGAA